MEIPQESITLKSITLTKAEAAIRQIDAAIGALLIGREIGLSTPAVLIPWNSLNIAPSS
jgi:hypothetical protein